MERGTKRSIFDGHERKDVVEYREKFLDEMKKLLPYLVEFSEDGSMISKEYPEDCAVGGPNRRPVIMITHDESTFSANDGRRRVWTLDGHGILRPKGRGKGIMVSDFLLPWSRLNLFSLSPEKQQELATQGVPLEAAVYFEYGKTDDGYWTGEELLDQVVKKALPIGEVLYPGYELLFIFDNATSHSVYAKDALQIGNMNKYSGGQQSFLRPGWYERVNRDIISQEMSLAMQNPETGQLSQFQKGIQTVLVERGLWPQRGL